ncbi:aminoglycoside phosphotransferase family protein [Paenibacillus sp. JCM 10914]|nr:hypothetical protein JCM10914_1284 [Paenibacillus sp. JCM 10914]
MNHPYNLQFDKLIDVLNLGEIRTEPVAISGGLLHRMYSLETTSGRYAIKALNPQIMARETALPNYIFSEKIANIAVNHIPALPAKIMDDQFVHTVDNQSYLVFDWIDGYSLKSHEVNVVHCKKMGAILADIHKIDFSSIEKKMEHNDHKPVTDWNAYLRQGEAKQSDWVPLLLENINPLFIWSDKANQSSGLLAAEQVISHGDLEPKNVMWVKEHPVIIDWESAGYRNSMTDLIETAIYWSVDGSGEIKKERFLAFIYGYQGEFGSLQANWRVILEHGYLGKLEWLEYSLKRSLGIESADEEEQHLGTLQVAETIHALKQYEDRISELEVWLNKEV